ncbi:CpsD/CapB family tyrosine-protein kinase [uncultured Sphingomonas sp.]|uniref:CpsD/CapB family tyrosine-protein kinase n=1 Tax=uncultured Sphingomonas sp. TaxID=158754 RepID=UPI0025FDBC28|nr:CpsD/CapB family tyrosine-protein kinase [uncultured Sphingomonas sp.]
MQANPMVDDGTAMARPLFTDPTAIRSVAVAPEQLDAQNIVGFRNADTRARPFKLIRSQILRRSQDEGLKLIGVTSAAPNVGKTFVASNLAAALSRIGDMDVVLLDLDLHRPAVAGRFSFDPKSPGVHDFLSGEAPIEQVARRINDERLVVIPGFRRDVATGELLTSDRSEQLFAGLRALGPNVMVVVDMPPIFADDDAVIIGQRLDGYVLVAEDGRTTAKQVRETVRMLSPTPLIGSVLNRYRSQLLTDEYGYGMSYGYGGYY